MMIENPRRFSGRGDCLERAATVLLIVPVTPTTPTSQVPDNSSNGAADGADAQPRLSRVVVALLALTAGAAVANLWYIQPLLSRVAEAFHVSDGTAGLLVTCAQV